MARPFEIAVEETSTADFDIQGVTVSDVVEESQAAEDIAGETISMCKDEEALEELCEEQDKLLDQQDDINGVTVEGPTEEQEVESQITTSEEALKYAMVRLGYDQGVKERIEFAKESFNSPLDKLAVTHESIGEFLKNIWDAIKAIISRIINATKRLFIKLKYRISRYGKKVEVLKQRLKVIEDKKARADISKFTTADLTAYAQGLHDTNPLAYYAKLGNAGTNLDFITDPKLAVGVMKEATNLIKAQVSNAITVSQGSAKYDENAPTELKGFWQNFVYGMSAIFSKSIRHGKAVDDLIIKHAKNRPASFGYDAILLGNVANTIYYIPDPKYNPGKNLIHSFTAFAGESSPTGELTAKFNTAPYKVLSDISSVKNMLSKTEALVKGAKDSFSQFDKLAGEYLDLVKKAEKDSIKALPSTKDKAEKAGITTTKYAIKHISRLLKVGAGELNLFCVRKYVYDIKSAVGLVTLDIGGLEKMYN